MFRIIFLVVLLSMLTACATTSTDYGPNPYRLDDTDLIEERRAESEMAQSAHPPNPQVEALLNSGDSEFLWENFGANPFARSRSDAIERFSLFLELVDIPQEIREALIEEVQEAGSTEYLVPGSRLDIMASGGVLTEEVVIHRNVQIVDTPGARAGLTQAIRAEVWRIRFQYGGKEYELELILPEVCFNWSIRIREVPPEVPATECSVVEFDVEEQDVIAFAVQNTRPSLTSECWGIRLAGNTRWSVLPTRCDVCSDEWNEAIDAGWDGPIHTSGATVVTRAGRFQMRVPQEALDGHITFCMWRQSERNQSCSLTVEPRDWRADDRPEFSESFFIRDRHWNFSGQCDWQRVS